MKLGFGGQDPVTVNSAVMGSPGSTVLLAVVGVSVLTSLAYVLRQRLKMQDNIQKNAQSAGQGNESDPNITRPVMAILLVGTVVILAAASLTLADPDTRNILVGAIVSLSSAVVAFYFASSGATDVRRDLLAATSGLQAVPDLVGKTVMEALATMGSSQLALVLPESQPAGSTVASQEPVAGSTIKGTRSVKVVLASASSAKTDPGGAVDDSGKAEPDAGGGGPHPAEGPGSGNKP